MTRRLLSALSSTALAALALVPTAQADTETQEGLPLGSADLPETRTSSTLARGVTWTRIVRGDEPAPEDEIGTTQRGPWVVNTLTIDPRKARGELVATYGPDIARTETVTDLVSRAGGTVGTNASFFTFTASKEHPGDPVGLGIYEGMLRSEPTGDAKESQVVFHAKSGRLAFGPVTWSGTAVDRRAGTSLEVDSVEHPPARPDGCPDSGPCTLDGETSWITTEFGARTPSGPGAEVVLDRRGCVVRSTSETRGTALARGQVAVQATGADAAALRTVATSRTCLTLDQSLTDDSGRRVPLTPDTYGVNGRYTLTRGGDTVVPPAPPGDSFFGRNPRTLLGRTADGTIVIATIDGRRTSSVGTTMEETARVAQSLGLLDAINLDGGGSTTLASPTEVLNTPSNAGAAQRPVGDALVWVPSGS